MSKSAAIYDGVVQAHLAHFCPGGLGVPVTSSGPLGWPMKDAELAEDANMLAADGETCGRCGEPLTDGRAVRRRLTGVVVHESC